MKGNLFRKFTLPTVLKVVLSACLFLLFSAANAQNDAKVKGRIQLVSDINNTLIIKLQVQAIHNTDPTKILKITNGSLWVRYNDSIVSLSEQPLPATNANLTDGDYFYPNLQSANYTEKVLQRQTKPDAIKETSLFALAHFVYEVPVNTTGVAEPINNWTDIAIFKYAIKQSGYVQLKWNVLAMENEIYDEDLNKYSVNKIDFPDWVGYVTYSNPILKLTSVGEGTTGDPYMVTVISTNNTQRQAGTAGFRIYYSSDEVDGASVTDQLNNPPFFWGNATIADEPISDIWKDGELYNRRITYTSNDGTQGNDYWPALNSLTPKNLLAVVFTPKAGNTTGVMTYLEVIGQESFKNWDETSNHIVLVDNPTRNPGSNAGNNALPVSLVSFSGNLQPDHTVLLKWATALEKNNDRFVVERSANGKEFSEIGTVKGNGTTSEYHTYNFTDISPLSGLSYYRLKQTDLDGTFNYSGVVVIKNTNTTESLSLKAAYPNPFADNFTLSYTLPASETLTLSLLDMLGRTVKKLKLEGKAGINSITLENLQELSKGVYMVRLESSSEQACLKLVKE